MKYFTDLARVVTERWRSRDFDHRFLPEFAAEAMAKMLPSENVAADDIIKWVEDS